MPQPQQVFSLTPNTQGEVRLLAYHGYSGARLLHTDAKVPTALVLPLRMALMKLAGRDFLDNKETFVFECDTYTSVVWFSDGYARFGRLENLQVGYR
jgi:hypothetical protein